MPVCSDPNAALPYVLKSDRQLPAPQPTFRVRNVTRAKSRTLVERIDALPNLPTGADIEAAAVAMFGEVVKGWDHMTLEGEPVAAGADPTTFLQLREIMEVVRFAAVGDLEPDEKKA